jgi:hypothetical protein
MSSQSIKRQSPQNEQHTTDAARAHADRRDVAGHRRPSRSRSIGRPAPTYTQDARLRRLLSRRPRGHVIGRAIAQPPPLSVDGRPRGQVVGRAIGEPPALSVDGRPRGLVVGRAIGEPPAFSNTGRPRGHVVGTASPLRSGATH